MSQQNPLGLCLTALLLLAGVGWTILLHPASESRAEHTSASPVQPSDAGAMRQPVHAFAGAGFRIPLRAQPAASAATDPTAGEKRVWGGLRITLLTQENLVGQTFLIRTEALGQDGYPMKLPFQFTRSSASGAYAQAVFSIRHPGSCELSLRSDELLFSTTQHCQAGKEDLTVTLPALESRSFAPLWGGVRIPCDQVKVRWRLATETSATFGRSPEREEGTAQWVIESRSWPVWIRMSHKGWNSNWRPFGSSQDHLRTTDLQPLFFVRLTHHDRRSDKRWSGPVPHIFQPGGPDPPFVVNWTDEGLLVGLHEFATDYLVRDHSRDEHPVQLEPSVSAAITMKIAMDYQLCPF